MTENEAIKVINDKYETFFALSTTNVFDIAMATAIKALEEIQQYRAIGTVEQLEWCKDASHWKELFKEKLEKYEAIGTIEEFKTLKEKKNFLPIATITFSKEQLQEIVDEKIGEVELDIQKIRAKAIDEFAHQLKENLNQEFPSNYESTKPFFALENARLIIDDVAEQMKVGEENE